MSSAATIGISNGVDSKAGGKELTSEQVATLFLKRYYKTIEENPDDLWLLYTIGSYFAHADGVTKQQIPLPLEPVQVKENPLELKAVIQKLGYAGCRPTPLCFDVTGDITTGMLILVSGMMIKKGGAPEEYCQTFYLKREIVEGVARKPVIEQDILRYTGSNKEAYTTFMSALSDTEQKNQAKSFEISDSSVVSTKAVSEKTNGEVSVKSVSVSSKEAKEGNESGPNDDDEENEDEQEEDEDLEMDPNSKETSVDPSKMNKKRNKRKNKKKEVSSGKKEVNSMEETKVNPSTNSSDTIVSKPSAPVKPKSFRDVVGKNPNSTSNSNTQVTSTKVVAEDTKKENEVKSIPTDTGKEIPVSSTQDDDEDGFKSRSKPKRPRDQNDSNGNGKSSNGAKDNATDIRSVHIKFTDDEGTLSANTEQKLKQMMGQFGTVLNVSSNYPQYAFVDFNESKAAIAALNSTTEFPAFKIQQKTQKKQGGRNGDRRRNNTKDGQNKTSNSNGQNGNRRPSGNNNNRFKREGGGKNSN